MTFSKNKIVVENKNIFKILKTFSNKNKLAMITHLLEESTAWKMITSKDEVTTWDETMFALGKYEKKWVRDLRKRKSLKFRPTDFQTQHTLISYDWIISISSKYNDWRRQPVS